MNSIVEVPPYAADIGVIWVCLNSVCFNGNPEAMRAHRRLLKTYRRKIAKLNEVDPSEIESEMIEFYEDVAKSVARRRRQEARVNA